MQKRKRTPITADIYATASSTLQGRTPRTTASRITGAHGLRTSDPLPQFVSFGPHKPPKPLYPNPVDNNISYDGPTNAANGNVPPKETPAGNQCHKRLLPQDPLARGQLWPTAAAGPMPPIDGTGAPHKRPRGTGHPMLAQPTPIHARPLTSGDTTPFLCRKMPALVEWIQDTPAPVIDSDHEIGPPQPTPLTQPKTIPEKTMEVGATIHRRVRGAGDTTSPGNREQTVWGGTCNRPTAAAFFTETPTRVDETTHTPGNLPHSRQPREATLLTKPIITAMDPYNRMTNQHYDTVQATTGPHSPPPAAK